MIKLAIILPVALIALLYGGGYIGQFIYNYQVWEAAGGVFGTSPQFPSGHFSPVSPPPFTFPMACTA